MDDFKFFIFGKGWIICTVFERGWVRCFDRRVLKGFQGRDIRVSDSLGCEFYGRREGSESMGRDEGGCDVEVETSDGRRSLRSVR
jgi:hypothetical protein